MDESVPPFVSNDQVPNWVFYTQVLERALHLMSQTLKTSDPSAFLRAESQVALAESQEAVAELNSILRQLSHQVATMHQRAPLPRAHATTPR